MSASHKNVICLTSFRRNKTLRSLNFSFHKASHNHNQNKPDSAKNSPSAPHVISGHSDKLFGSVMQKNKEVKKRLQENRLRENSQVLLSYQIKK
ncbi:MAG: hypothetical protein OXC40_06215 [Proteobacteria bacterium]|nr:hypothetical protein [Pseudomonadota bacterium]